MKKKEDVLYVARIRGSRDERSSRDDYYEDQPPRRSERRNSASERPDSGR